MNPPLGEVDVGRDGDLALLALDADVVAKVFGLPLNFDAILQERLL